MTRLKTAMLGLALLSSFGCGRAPSLAGRVEDIVGVEGEYFPNSEDQRTPFKGGAAEGQALGRIILAGKPHEPCKCRGRGCFVLKYADGKTESVTVFKPENTIGMDGGGQYEVNMAALTALLVKLASAK